MRARLLGERGVKRGVLLVLSAVLLSGTATSVLAGQPGGLPPESNAFGKPLSEWFKLYWAQALWSAVGVDMPDHVGHVKFLPIPAGEYTGGAGTAEDPAVYAGQLELTLKAGTAFVLPVAGWTGWTYDPGSGIPDDLTLKPSAFYGTVHVDGRPISLGYVAPVFFDSTIPLPPEAFPGVGVLYVQGLAFVHQPLSVGQHTITLVARVTYPDPDYTGGVEFQNTWIITVKP